MRITLETIERVRREYPEVWPSLQAAIRKLALGLYTKLTPEEKRALALAYYLQSPWAYRVDIAKRGHVGNPLRDPYADVPGVDTPDRESLANYYWARSYLLSHRPGQKTLHAYVAPARREEKQRAVPLEEAARFIVYAGKLVEDARKAYDMFDQVLASRDYGRIADYAEYLARLAVRLREAYEEARKLYHEFAGVEPLETEVKVGGRTIYVKPELHRLERDLDSLYHSIKGLLVELARQSVEAARKLAEKYEGMKLGLRYRQLYEELEKLYREARAPEDYARVVRKLAEHMSLEAETKSLAERARELRTEAIKLAREMREIARELERLKEPLRRAREERLLVSLARTVGGLEGYAEYLERAAHTEPDYYIASERFQNILRAARERLEEARRLLEELRGRVQPSGTAVHEAVRAAPPPARPKGHRWPAEVVQLADYLWENIPRRERRRWSYIQVLQLARLIISKAREAGVDWRGIDWAHEIDWHQGYAAAKQKVLSLLGVKAAPTEKEIEEYRRYMEQQMEMLKPAWMEEKPEEWEMRAWEAAAIPA